jgi:hypothetical protein
MFKQKTMDGTEYNPEIKTKLNPPKPLENVYCFNCTEPITSQEDIVKVYVRRDFCHSSYWENDNKKIYGEIKDETFGYLYIHKAEAEESENNYGTPMGEDYEWCNGCGVIFSDRDLSTKIYEASGELLCPVCAHDYVKDNIEEFLNEGMPDLEKGHIPSINLDEEDLTDIPNLVRAPEDTQGWCSSIDPIHTHDIGHGTWQEALKAVVDRGHKWLIHTTSTNNCCAISVEVYEYIEK